jgi:bifunctional UDP-N-acetylglucosamine pyrophosphorylase/glucosamine-1-phosphate N-acetyltransferase
MKAVFLCGGIGKRMRPITEDKFLLDFLGKTLLEHQIDMAREAGLTAFIMVGNPQNIGDIEKIVTSIPDIKAELVIQKEPLGIADALENARQFLDGEIIVVNPNDVFETSAYTRLLKAHQSNSATSYLLGYKVSEYFPGGYLVVGEDGNLRHIVEKPEPGREPSNLVNILVHLHTNPRSLLSYAAGVQTKNDDIYECAIDKMVKDTGSAKVIPYTGLWDTIKYPWHIFTMVQRFLDQSQEYISPSAEISDRATIGGKVIISDNVRVLENAVVRGPAYIGPNSVIGNSSLVREYSHIGADCVVGYCTEVKGSYIGNGCWFHMSYIGDSIIGNGCSFGAGTVLSNLRFDEKSIWVKMDGKTVDTGLSKFGAIIGNNCKTGVNANVMPGRRIGSNSIVGSHVCLNEDLGPDMIALAEPVYKTTRNKFQPGAGKESQAEEVVRDLTCVE